MQQFTHTKHEYIQIILATRGMPTSSKHKYKYNDPHTQNMNKYRSFWRRAGCPQALAAPANAPAC